MKVKTYKAMDMKAAITQIKQDLGSQAVIISTRKVTDGKRAFGLLGRPMVEVTAASDSAAASPENAPAVESPSRRSESGFPPKLWEWFRNELQDLRNEIVNLAQAGEANIPIHPEVEAGLEELRWWASYSARKFEREDVASTGDFRKIFYHLVKRGMKEAHALRIVERLQKVGDETGVEEETTRRRLVDLLTRLVRIDVPSVRSESGPLVLALVGPTGVGKTTTAAKMAAQCALEQGMKVALVTNDTYRIAAAEQLRTYARIMSVPLEVALSPSDLPQILETFSDKEMILIDTVGRSPFDSLQMGQLRGFLTADPRIKSLLLVSATTEARELERLIHRYGPLNPVGLIVTKLDEATRFGALFSASLQNRLPFTFITNGQRVPEDIRQATAEEVVSWTLWGVPCFYQGAEQATVSG